ncbi:MAG: 4-hydroxy-tetrahydrodipicolinate synthase [Kineosporiaceae bacterium]
MPHTVAGPSRPFGRLLTAMVTPMRADTSVDLDAAAHLADHLVAAGHDGLVVSGTTGEAPTTTDAEKTDLLRAVVAAVGGRAHVVAGVGTNDTAHSVHLAREAAAAGAHGLLLVAPYYSKPTQAGLIAHATTVADATDLPVMLYDIPGRCCVEFATETIVQLADHPRIVAMKDAKGDLQAATRVQRVVDLGWYSGDGAMTLPHLALGGAGVVGVATHVAGPYYVRMLDAVDKGDLPTALLLHRGLQPVEDAIMTRLPGVVATKAVLAASGRIPGREVRLPLATATGEDAASLHAEVTAALATLDLALAGVPAGVDVTDRTPAEGFTR